MECKIYVKHYTSIRIALQDENTQFSFFVDNLRTPLYNTLKPLFSGGLS